MENSMSEKKLRPEQRKLWRRIYLTAFENGANANEAAYEADTAVQFWDERGAFEVEVAPNASTSPTTTWDAFSITVGRMLRDDRTIEQIAELRVAYPDEFDFMRELVAQSAAAPVVLSDVERFSKLRQVMESGTASVCIDGIPAGFVTHWEETQSPNRPVTKLCLTVEANFSLLK